MRMHVQLEPSLHVEPRAHAVFGRVPEGMQDRLTRLGERELRADADRWNPRVLDVIAKKRPKSLIDVADAYGDLFVSVHQAWLKGLQTASAEASPGAEIIPL